MKISNLNDKEPFTRICLSRRIVKQDLLIPVRVLIFLNHESLFHKTAIKDCICFLIYIGETPAILNITTWKTLMHYIIQRHIISSHCFTSHSPTESRCFWRELMDITCSFLWCSCNSISDTLKFGKIITSKFDIDRSSSYDWSILSNDISIFGSLKLELLLYAHSIDIQKIW